MEPGAAVGDHGEAGEEIRPKAVRDGGAIVERVPGERCPDVRPRGVVARELLNPSALRLPDLAPTGADGLKGLVDVQVSIEHRGRPPRRPDREAAGDRAVDVVDVV